MAKRLSKRSIIGIVCAVLVVLVVGCVGLRWQFLV